MSDFKTREIAETILPLLDGVKQTGDQQWIARCPVHDDSRASLSISAGDDGRVLFHCHAGCSTEQIVSKLGLSMSDLFPKNPKRRKRKEIVATYHYKNGAQKLRYNDKSFTWRQPDGRGSVQSAGSRGLQAGDKVSAGTTNVGCRGTKARKDG